MSGTAPLPSPARLMAAMEATWPPVRAFRSGAFLLRQGDGGGSRVSAGTLEAAAPEGLEAAEAAMRAMGQVPLFQLRPGQEAFDSLLAARGYAVKDPVSLYAMAAARAGAEAVPPGLVSGHWPPRPALAGVWAEGGIGPERLAVMARAAGPKVALLGHVDGRPAGAAFVAADGDVAMIHAVEVLPIARRRGLGRALMLQAADWSARQGCRWLGLAVTRANGPANALYAGIGMAAVTAYHYRILEGAA